MSAKDIVNQSLGNQAPAAKQKTVFDFLADHKEQIALALPKHMNPDRMARVAMTCIRTIPKLMDCKPQSLFGAIIQCSQLGLEPGTPLGHAYLLPFDKKERRGSQWVVIRTDVQLIIGYRGMLDLARRSGQIESIEAHAVYDGDLFECELGLDSKLRHVPDWSNPKRDDPKNITFVYAVAKLKDGGVQFQVMGRKGVEQIRARSKSKDNGPWMTDWEQMALKTVVRRLFKWLPVSIEIQNAVAIDESAELGQQYVFNGLAKDNDHIEMPPIENEPDQPVTKVQLLEMIESSKNIDDAMLIQDLANSLTDDEKIDINVELGKKFPDIGLDF